MSTISMTDQTGRQMNAFNTACGIVFIPAELFRNADMRFFCRTADGMNGIEDARFKVYTPEKIGTPLVFRNIVTIEFLP